MAEIPKNGFHYTPEDPVRLHDSAPNSYGRRSAKPPILLDVDNDTMADLGWKARPDLLTNTPPAPLRAPNPQPERARVDYMQDGTNHTGSMVRPLAGAETLDIVPTPLSQLRDVAAAIRAARGEAPADAVAREARKQRELNLLNQNMR